MRIRPAILLATLATAPALAQEQGVPRTLLDRSLHERQIRLLGLDTATVRYEEAGLVRTDPVTENLAILPPPPPPPKQGDLRASAGPDAPTLPATFLQLADGQLLTGALATDHPAGQDAVRWVHPLLGPVELKLDQVLRIRLPGQGDPLPLPPLPTASAADLVLLANGDRLEGFVESIASALTVSIDDQKRTIPIDRVREIALANPAAAPRGPVALLRDGSILRVRQVHTGRMGEVALTPALLQSSESADSAASPALALADIRAYVFDAAAILPLAEVPITRQTPAAGRRWSPPAGPARAAAPLDARDIELPGAMTVEWKLPDSATRLGATVRLPRAAWNWGQCRVRVSVVSGGAPATLLQATLSADAPEAPLNAPLPPGTGRTLVVALEPGAYGPVQTRVTLARPVLLAAPAQP
jgi:hypothetical protein